MAFHNRRRAVAWLPLILWTTGLALPADAVLAGSASGYALTFDGRGTDVASTFLSPDLFGGMSGVTFSTWIRSFGMIGSPFRSVPVTMSTPASSNWFQPIFWSYTSGDDWLLNVFESSIRISGMQQLHISEFRRWRHVALTWERATGALRLFVDGVLLVNKTDVKRGYDVGAGAAGGVYLGVGIYALNATSQNPPDCLRGSLDQLQLWTSALDEEQIRQDFRTLGRSSTLPSPALRYLFDEGSGEAAANTGWAPSADLRLGSSPDGLRFFVTASSTTFHYTSPAWAPSILPLNGSAALGNAPVVRTYLPGSSTNISLFIAASTPMVRIVQLPAHGKLLLEGSTLSAGAQLPRRTVLTFSTAHNTSMVPTTFAFTAVGDGAAANGTFHLVPESPPRVVSDPADCRWPLGTCAQFKCRES